MQNWTLPRLGRKPAELYFFITLYYSLEYSSVVFLVSYLRHLVSHMLPVVCGHFPACLAVSCVWSLRIAQSTGRFRSQLGGFLEKFEHWIPNFSVNRDLLISFMLSLISEHWAPACIVLTRWNFLCGKTYIADSLHQLKTDLCLQRKPLFFPPLLAVLNVALM